MLSRAKKWPFGNKEVIENNKVIFEGVTDDKK
jgi:hypothetical protein